ncbi:Structural maintenance of chromosomes protein 4 [Coemansia sp. RSA 2050]|nr:Structural maintenance of chromosomes protein 4 [Coemansia sp. RSA 2050]KAJ2731665.1 Structural maintenance of chromosomes protein 4 [Coemansia sp. BCRC 34962]
MTFNEMAESLAINTQDLDIEMAPGLAVPKPSTANGTCKVEAGKPRLIITQMVLENFKSYAGRQVIGPFHRSFSAIVGPNGSGKSNVIDALLFVFGYRANKIRQGRLSELIHSSKNAGQVSQCSVEVHFREVLDSADGSSSEDIEGSEVVVARTATLSNQSKYMVNGGSSSYTEVTGLLRSKGIDLDHKRFLILQGEVENISQMKAMGQSENEVGLLEYLEDIIGTSAYKGQIEEARKQVDELSAARSERLHRVKIVEKEKNSLEDKKNEALAFIQTENELTVQKSALYQKRQHESKAKEAAERAKYEAARLACASEEARHAAMRNEAQELEETRALTEKECKVLDRRAKEVAEELSKAERSEVQLQVNRKHIKGKLKKAQDSGDKEAHSMQQLRSTVGALESDMDSGRKEAADVEQRVGVEREALEEISAGLGSKTAELTAAIGEKQQELAPWRERIGAHEARLELAQTELGVLDERAGAAERALEAAKAELRRLRDERVARAAAAEARVAELARVNEELEAADRAVQVGEGRAAAGRAAALEARRREEEARAAAGAAQRQSAVLRAVLRQRDLGRIGGIHGRLGALGAIDDAYDVAVSSACGAALDSIVVQTVAAGQACVEFLRASGVGRARFVILDTLRPRAAAPGPAPEGVRRLVDLVRPASAELLPAFQHALGDTLVAADLEQARRVAYGGARRHRVVSMDGAVLEPAGTMSGGGCAVARGAMGSRAAAPAAPAAPAALGRLAAAREAADAHLAELQAALRAATAARQQLQARYDALEALLPRLELELAAADEQVQMAKRRARGLADDAARAPADGAARAAAAARVATEEESIRALQAQCGAIDAAVRALQDRVMQAGGIRLRAQKARVDGLRDRLATIADDMARWAAAHARANADLARAERQAAARAHAAADLGAQLAAVTAEIDALSLHALAVRDRADAARALADTRRALLDRTRDAADAKAAELDALRARGAKLKRAADDAERALADASRAANYWASERAHLALHALDGAVEGAVEGAAQAAADADAPPALPDLSEAELSGIDAAELQASIEQAEARLQRTRPNLSVLPEYARRAAEHAARSAELDAVSARRDEAQRCLDCLRTRRLDEFMAGFSVISYHLKEMYQMITLGGSAELELVDSLDPFSEGIVFSVMPPKKSWKNISNLSGGEKTLSSLALVFALHQYKPTPLYVMDEIDAALDFRNVSIVANYIKERTRNAQFVIISLRNNMFELADRLVGIYKTDNQTKSIALDTEHTVGALYDEVAAA